MGTDREIVIAGRYLHFPIRNEAPKRLVGLLSEGRLVHEAEMELADGRVDFWAPMDGLYRRRRQRAPVERPTVYPVSGV